MNREQLRQEVAFLVNFTEGTADQDFTVARLNKAIQYAYRNEVRQAKLTGLSRWFKKVAQISWPASQVRYKLPNSLSKKNIIAFWDITNSDPGYVLDVRGDSLSGSSLFWYEADTLQWASTGPSAATTLLIEYLADSEYLAADGDSPDLIPADYHDLLVWSAAIYLRTVGDEQPPSHWVAEREQFRYDFWKFLSKGRPFTDTPSVMTNLNSAQGFAQAEPTAGSGGLNP